MYTRELKEGTTPDGQRWRIELDQRQPLPYVLLITRGTDGPLTQIKGHRTLTQAEDHLTEICKRQENKTPAPVNSLLYTDRLADNHVFLYLFVPMSDKDLDRTPFLQMWTNPELDTREYWVADGYHNKKQYKTYKTAQNALNKAVGELVLAGYAPTRTLTGHYARIAKKMSPGFDGVYFN